MSKSRHEDLSGNVFGLLTAVEFLGTRGKHAEWRGIKYATLWARLKKHDPKDTKKLLAKPAARI